MGFFDRPVQDKSKVKVFTRPEELVTGFPGSSQQPQSTSSFNPPDVTSFQRKRAALLDAIYKTALSIKSDAERSYEGSIPDSGASQPRYLQDEKGNVIQPGSISRFIEQTKQPNPEDQDFRNLQQLESQYLKLQQTGIAKQINTPFAEEQIKRLEAQKAQLFEDAPFQVTEAGKQKQEQDLANIDQAIQQQKLISTKQTPQEDPGSFDDLYRNMGANDRFKHIMIKGATNLDMMGQLFAPVGMFGAAAFGILNKLGPQAQQKFYGDLMGGMELKEAKGDVVAAQQKQAELSRKFKELSAAPEMKSNMSVLSFILISLLVGPRMALEFYLRKKQNGTLGAELSILKNDIQQSQRQEMEAQRNYNQVRREVLRNRMIGGREEQRRQFALSRDAMRMMRREQSPQAIARGINSDPLLAKLKFNVLRAEVAIKNASYEGDSETMKKWENRKANDLADYNRRYDQLMGMPQPQGAK